MGHFGEGSKKQGFTVDWMPSGGEGDSWIGSLMVFFETVGGVKPGPLWDWQRSCSHSCYGRCDWTRFTVCLSRQDDGEGWFVSCRISNSGRARSWCPRKLLVFSGMWPAVNAWMSGQLLASVHEEENSLPDRKLNDSFSFVTYNV